MSEYKDKWIAALRSGEYKQGRSSLCAIQDDGSQAYCCLGVLAELDGVLEESSMPSSILPSVQRSVRDAQGHLDTYMYEGEGQRLTSVEVEPPLETEKGDMALPWMVAHLNDAGWTFEQIADYLEKVDF